MPTRIVTLGTKMLSKRLVTPAAVFFFLLSAAPMTAQTFPDEAGDEVTASLGRAIIYVNPPFRNLVDMLPGWDQPLPDHWTTPLMRDPLTLVGRSAPHTDASADDTQGVPVGTAGTLVRDADFAVVPTVDFTEGPAGTREIHTEIYRLDLVDECGLNFCIRAGTSPTDAKGNPRTPVARPSFGEVEALPGSEDFPAESFFTVFIEMDTPFFGGTTLHNLEPLLVVNPELNDLPPNVVYIHEETPAVQLIFLDGPNAGQVFGLLRLAGHAMNVECPDPCNNCPSEVHLDDALAASQLMSCDMFGDGFESGGADAWSLFSGRKGKPKS